jgi:HSP20 family protein
VAAEDGRYFRFERRLGTFTRTIGLPQGVTDESVSASYKNGVLEVHVAKPEQSKPRKIQVGSGDGKEAATIEGSSTRK